MTPRLDPALPLVWRSPDELQLGGVHPVAVIADPRPFETGLLTALAAGASRETLTTIGAALDADRGDVADLLERLAPALLPEAASAAPERAATIAIDGEPDRAAALAGLLSRLGHRGVRAPAAAPAVALDAVVLIASRVVSPAAHLPWLAADVPHLAVVFDERGAEVGPFVRPGAGPCLRCVHLARRDADAAWPAIAAQLAVAPPPPRAPRVEHEALALAASVVDDLVRFGRTQLDDAAVLVSAASARDLRTAPRPVAPHPECGCRAPAGSATAPARLDARRNAPPSSTSADAVPA
jgi:bacteriocin biosynthesis cyclodehydratase domain-containing protein